MGYTIPLSSVIINFHHTLHNLNLVQERKESGGLIKIWQGYSLTTSTVTSTVQLTPFSGSPTEDIRVFKEQTQSLIAIAQIPDAGKVAYLKPHLTGGA